MMFGVFFLGSTITQIPARLRRAFVDIMPWKGVRKLRDIVDVITLRRWIQTLTASPSIPRFST